MVERKSASRLRLLSRRRFTVSAVLAIVAASILLVAPDPERAQPTSGVKPSGAPATATMTKLAVPINVLPRSEAPPGRNAPRLVMLDTSTAHLVEDPALGVVILIPPSGGPELSGGNFYVGDVIFVSFGGCSDETPVPGYLDGSANIAAVTAAGAGCPAFATVVCVAPGFARIVFSFPAHFSAEIATFNVIVRPMTLSINPPKPVVCQTFTVSASGGRRHCPGPSKAAPA